MKLKPRWVLILIIIGLLVGSIALFSQWRDGAFLNLQGQLLLSGPVRDSTIGSNLDSRKVYIVSLDGQYRATPHYLIDDFDEIRLSERRETEEIYVAKHFKEKYYTVLSVQNDSVKELMRSSTPIIFPTLRDNGQSIVYFGRPEKSLYEHYLYRYNTQQKTITLISNLPVVWWSRPIFMSDGSIICSVIEKYTPSSFGNNIQLRAATIMKINTNGESQSMVSGIFPTLQNSGNSFYYYDLPSKAIQIYDIATNNKKMIAHKTWVVSQPALSRDGKYLAFHELLADGKITNIRLQIMTTDGLVKRTIFNPDIPLSHNNNRVSDIIWSQ